MRMLQGDVTVQHLDHGRVLLRIKSATGEEFGIELPSHKADKVRGAFPAPKATEVPKAPKVDAPAPKVEPVAEAPKEPPVVEVAVVKPAPKGDKQ
jgi:hypothetical protein